MKKPLMLLLIAVLSIYACTNNTKKENFIDVRTLEISKVKDGEIDLTDKKDLILNIENNLKNNQNIAVILKDLKIQYSKAIDNDKVDIIQLIGENDNGSIKVSYQLEKINEVFKIISNGSIVVCKGCDVGCNPKRKENGDGYCTDCNSSDTIDCEKTVYQQSFKM